MKKSRLLRFAVFAGLILTCGAIGRAETLFSYVDENGVRIFTNIPPKGPVLGLKTSGQAVPPPGDTAPGADKNAGPSFDLIIDKYAEEYRLDPSLIRSMIATESSFNPKAALVYKPFEQTTLRVSAGKAFRAPTVYELYRTWVSSSGVTYAGNPDLKPETTVSWDIGCEQGLWKGAKIKGAYFENYLSDLIYRNSITPTLLQNSNVGEATVKGVEMEAEQRFGNWLRVFGSFTWNDAKVTKNDPRPQIVGQRLTFMPQWLYSLGVDFTKGPFSTYLVGRYASKVYSNDQNLDTVEKVYGSYDPYFIADATVSYKITNRAKISLSVNNIFDADYFYYYKTPGRSWFGELTLQY